MRQGLANHGGQISGKRDVNPPRVSKANQRTWQGGNYESCLPRQLERCDAAFASSGAVPNRNKIARSWSAIVLVKCNGFSRRLDWVLL